MCILSYWLLVQLRVSRRKLTQNCKRKQLSESKSEWQKTCVKLHCRHLLHISFHKVPNASIRFLFREKLDSDFGRFFSQTPVKNQVTMATA